MFAMVFSNSRRNTRFQRKRTQLRKSHRNQKVMILNMQQRTCKKQQDCHLAKKLPFPNSGTARWHIKWMSHWWRPCEIQISLHQMFRTHANDQSTGEYHKLQHISHFRGVRNVSFNLLKCLKKYFFHLFLVNPI